MKKITIDYDKTLNEDLIKKLLPLKDKYDLYIVTGRSKDRLDNFEVNLKGSLLSIPDSKIIFAGDKKGQTLNKLNPLIHIDDSTVKDFSGKTVKGGDFRLLDYL